MATRRLTGVLRCARRNCAMSSKVKASGLYCLFCFVFWSWNFAKIVWHSLQTHVQVEQLLQYVTEPVGIDLHKSAVDGIGP